MLLSVAGPSWANLFDDDDQSVTSEQAGERERGESKTEEHSESEDDDDPSLEPGLIASARAPSVVHIAYQKRSPRPGYSDPPLRPPVAVRG
ncbi:hypothetical protein ENSA7_46760 [Enhygromyxa salina]|uniref:Uncharacterized protein n=1 Tax=Enhygromyxa salina TaxID=215803 RepID=A0A2S9YJL5_9BACT|nr:hypothetical protein ENSA7_46760 [Enhygromyxa salina]